MNPDDSTVVFLLSNSHAVLIDEVDAVLLQFKWHADRKGYVSHGYVKSKLPEPMCFSSLMHRVILMRAIGRQLNSTEQVDHINGNICDNRRSNLRIASHGENMRNSKAKSSNTSGFKGVSIFKGTRWRAKICVDRKQIHLGYFDTPEEAYRAYCDAAKKYHGEFARVA